MKKLIKVLVVLVACVAVLLLIGSILLRVYLPPEKAKALVLQHLSAQLKREVSLGSVSVGILSGLQMTDLKISESPTFAKGTFLSSEMFSLKVALMPLLFRKVIIRQIVLKHPEVMIVRLADGKTFNFSDLTDSTQSAKAPSQAPASEGKKESLPFLFLVSRAEIQQGAVHFVDRSPAKQSVDIAPFDLTLKNVSLTTPFSVQTSLHVKSKGSDLALNFAGDANLASGSFHIKQGSVVSKNSKITLSGDLKRLKSSEPAADLQVDIPQLVLADFATFFSLPPEAGIEGPWSGHALVQGDQKSMKVEASLDGAKTKIRYGASFVKPEKTPLSFSVQGVLKNLQEFELQNVKCVFASLALSGRGRVQNLTGAQPSFNTHFESNAFSLEDLLIYAPGALPPGITMKGTNQVNADLSGTPANIQFALKWDGTALAITKADQFAKPAGMPLDVTVVGNRPNPTQVIVKNLTARLGANQMTGSGTYETRGTQSLINFKAKGSNWSVPDLAKVSPLLAPYKPTGNLSFDVSAQGPVADPQTSVQSSADIAMTSIKHEFYEGQNLALKWNLTQITPDLSKVSGTSSLKQGPGKILNVEKLAQSSRIGKMALAPLEALAKIQQKGVLKQVNLPSLQSIPFDSLVGDYVLRSGTMDIKVFDMNGKDMTIQNRGTVGLAGVQPINLNVVMKLAAGSIGGSVGQILQDENGRPTVKFTATGTVADPHVKWDVQEVGKKAVQEILKNKDVQNAVDDLQKSLKGIFH